MYCQIDTSNGSHVLESHPASTHKQFRKQSNHFDHINIVYGRYKVVQYNYVRCLWFRFWKSNTGCFYLCWIRFQYLYSICRWNPQSLTGNERSTVQLSKSLYEWTQLDEGKNRENISLPRAVITVSEYIFTNSNRPIGYSARTVQGLKLGSRGLQYKQLNLVFVGCCCSHVVCNAQCSYWNIVRIKLRNIAMADGWIYITSYDVVCVCVQYASRIMWNPRVWWHRVQYISNGCQLVPSTELLDTKIKFNRQRPLAFHRARIQCTENVSVLLEHSPHLVPNCTNTQIREQINRRGRAVRSVCAILRSVRNVCRWRFCFNPN